MQLNIETVNATNNSNKNKALCSNELQIANINAQNNTEGMHTIFTDIGGY